MFIYNIIKNYKAENKSFQTHIPVGCLKKKKLKPL